MGQGQQVHLFYLRKIYQEIFKFFKFFFRSYSYYIEVSMDQKDWIRVVDYSKYYCRSWQELYFTPRVVRYIRIFGNYNTLNKVFHVVSLEAYYTKKPFQVDKHGVLSKFSFFDGHANAAGIRHYLIFQFRRQCRGIGMYNPDLAPQKRIQEAFMNNNYQ